MNRDEASTQKIALLATGDEISKGDILNTNAQTIAQQLYDLGLQVGMHMTTADNLTEIETAITFLLQNHSALIITGGLGPTSDDITRFALARALQQELVFHESVWQTIVDRLKKFGYQTPPESNRQQALLPAQAIVLPNPNGTAAGCMIEQNQKMIFMLPGPPFECLPMFKEFVIPALQAKHFSEKFYHQSWLLFRVSEGQIAEELDALVKPFQCTTGYRLAYPYLEFKIFSKHQSDFEKVIPLVDQEVSKYLISDGKQTASQMLKEKLALYDKKIYMHDKATGGFFESMILTPLTKDKIIFCDENFSRENLFFTLSGLEEYWESQKDATQSEVTLKTRDQSHQITLPYRGEFIKKAVVEWAASQIYRYLG